MSGPPEGWAAVSLDDLGRWGSGGTPKAGHADYYGGSIPFTKIGDLPEGRFSRTEDTLTEAGLAASAAKWVPANSLLIAMYGSIGKLGINTVPVTTNQAIAFVEPDPALTSTAFLFWLLTASRPELAAMGQGGTQQNISQKLLRAHKVALPPVAEQLRIVAKLDALTARTARARADLDRIPALAERYKLALLRTAMRGGLTESWRQQADLEPALALVERTPAPPQGRGGREATTGVVPGQAALSVNDPGTPAPDGWAWTPLLRIARQETGHTPSRSVGSYWGGEVPWIGIRDAGAHHGRTIERTLQTITEDGLANSSARVLPARTVCLSRTASVGYVTIMARPMATSQDFATWTCSGALEPEFLMYALMAEGDDIRAFGEGSTHTTIYFPEIRALHICLPPLAEQQEIIRRVRAGLIEIDRLATEAAAARRLLDRLDQAILAKAFRGELVPQDPADEPAGVLLERIRAERAAAPKSKRRGSAVAA